MRSILLQPQMPVGGYGSVLAEDVHALGERSGGMDVPGPLGPVGTALDKESVREISVRSSVQRALGVRHVSGGSVLAGSQVVVFSAISTAWPSHKAAMGLDRHDASKWCGEQPPYDRVLSLLLPAGSWSGDTDSTQLILREPAADTAAPIWCASSSWSRIVLQDKKQRGP